MESNPTIEQILSRYKNNLGKLFTPYRNHVYRVYYLSLAYLENPLKEEKEKISIASVFHDIGIWTNNTFDYLQPSIFLAREYLDAQNKAEWKKDVSLIIDTHHKIGSYHGDCQVLVEAFRKADWMDLSFGLIGSGLNHRLKELSATFPPKGFHWFLVRLFFRNLIKNPLRPFPMFKL